MIGVAGDDEGLNGADVLRGDASNKGNFSLSRVIAAVTESCSDGNAAGCIDLVPLDCRPDWVCQPAGSQARAERRADEGARGVHFTTGAVDVVKQIVIDLVGGVPLGRSLEPISEDILVLDREAEVEAKNSVEDVVIPGAAPIHDPGQPGASGAYAVDVVDCIVQVPRLTLVGWADRLTEGRCAASPDRVWLDRHVFSG